MEEMTHCMVCGAKLTHKYLKDEGEVPYCPNCETFRFPVFSVACSMIVLNRTKDRVLLIKQYNRDKYILVAGYVNKGEDAEATVKREVMEELGLPVTQLHFNRSHYFAPTNTLMLNFTVVVDVMAPSPNWEIDDWRWFPIDEARDAIMAPSLAKDFLDGYFDGSYRFGKELPADYKLKK